MTDKLEGQALSYERDYIDIYSASWGPRDDGKTMEKPHRLTAAALKMGAEQVRVTGSLPPPSRWALSRSGS